jgi:uncharacterized protein (TIGR03083 family)
VTLSAVKLLVVKPSVGRATLHGMDTTEHLATLEEQGRALALAADKAGLDADVPTCPRWTVRHLLGHLGMVHRWAASHVREGRAIHGQPALAKAPADGLLDWYVEGHAALVSTLRRAPADLDCWTFLAAPSPLAFWARRQAHETAIHRADAEAALGSVPDYPTDVAADGLDELLCGFMARRRGRLLAARPCTLLVAPTDAPGRWHITVGPDARQVRRDGELPAGCTISGPATDLYLALWNRIPAGPPTVTGDPAVLELWHTRATVTWK